MYETKVKYLGFITLDGVLELSIPSSLSTLQPQTLDAHDMVAACAVVFQAELLEVF